jgi:hypothetical protein
MNKRHASGVYSQSPNPVKFYSNNDKNLVRGFRNGSPNLPSIDGFDSPDIMRADRTPGSFKFGSINEYPDKKAREPEKRGNGEMSDLERRLAQY